MVWREEISFIAMDLENFLGWLVMERWVKEGISHSLKWVVLRIKI